MSDTELLRDYVASGSEAAFGRLVERHLGLVYSVCHRQLRDPGMTEDATQAVFVILARKARSVQRERVLQGWLYQTARYVAANARRADATRRRREMEAGMQRAREARKNEGNRGPDLDQALGRLRGKDRNAILLRFFEGRSFAEVGEAMSISEDAAKKRVMRGIGRLRQLLGSSREAPLASAAVIGLFSEAFHQPPAALLQNTVATCLGRAGAGQGAALAKEVMTMMLHRKLQLTTLTCVGVAALGTGTLVAAKAIASRHAAVVFVDTTSANAAKPQAPNALLDRKLPAIQFEKVAFSDAADFLKDMSGTAVVPDWPALVKVGVQKNTVVLLRTKYDSSLKQVLRLLLWQLADPGKLEYEATKNGITISTAEALNLPVPRGEAPEDAAARKALDKEIGDVAPEEKPLEAEVEELRERSGVMIWVNWRAFKKIGIDPSTPVTLPANTKATAAIALDEILKGLKPKQPLGRDVRDGIVILSTQENLKELHRVPHVEREQKGL